MTTRTAPYRISQAHVAAGHEEKRLLGKQVSVLFDREMFASIQARAKVEGTSFGEWGLEAEKENWG